MLTRREFLVAGALSAAGAGWSKAEHVLPNGATLTTVSDGGLVLPRDLVFAPMPQSELPAVIAPFDLDPERLTPECNLALLQTGDRVVLFDAGAGPDFQPSAGKIIDALDAIGLAPEDITDVVFTHAHPDHIWGVLDDFDEPLFYEATHHIGADELAYWTDPDTVTSIGEARASFAVGAKRRLDAIEGQLQVFNDGDEVIGGIVAISSPGHTPGHMAFQVEDSLILGDAIGNHHVAFVRPDWPSGSDQDEMTAVQTRKNLFERIVADQLTVVGFHLPEGGIGKVERAGDGFRFGPA